MSILLPAPSPLGGCTDWTQQWLVRRYELPFAPSEAFLSKLRDGDKDIDVRITGELGTYLEVAMGLAKGADADLAWIKFETYLDQVVLEVRKVMEDHEKLMMVKIHYERWHEHDSSY